MIERFARFPAYLAERARSVRLAGDIPALLAHPDWERPAPAVIWLHGRTANKELDPGRYLRWIRAGIGACAIDLPGHGGRTIQGYDGPARSLDVLAQMVREIDGIVAALGSAEWRGVFDPARLGIGGMSLGGMAALRRLCDAHPFRCAAVEATTGDLGTLYGPGHPANHAPQRVAELDPARHLETWKPIPLLVVHSEGDQLISFAGMKRFVERLRARYPDPSAVELVSWPSTGAPQEHLGFGRFSNDAKNAQTEFFARHLLPAT